MTNLREPERKKRRLPFFFACIVCFSCAKPAPVFNGEANYLSRRDIRLIREYWPDYEYAAQRTGVPAAMLAAIHKRESDLYKGWFSLSQRKVVKNVGGPFMLDLGPANDALEFERRVRQHEAMIWRAYDYPTKKPPRISHDFRFAVLVAAHHMKGKARCGLESEYCLAEASWGYNGRAAWHVNGDGEKSHTVSPYVWNDPLKGVRLKMRYKRRNGEVREYLDTRPGVMVLYREIKAFTGGHDASATNRH